MKINWRKWSEEEPEENKGDVVIKNQDRKCIIKFIGVWFIPPIMNDQKTSIVFVNRELNTCSWCYSDEVFGDG